MSNIHYGLHLEDSSSTEYDDTSLKSDIASLKTDLTAEKLKISTNKTNISVNKASITSEKTKLGNTQTAVNTLTGKVSSVENTAAANSISITGLSTSTNLLTSQVALANSSISTNTTNISTNKTAIAAVKSTADTNRQGLLVTPVSEQTYHLNIPDLTNSYRGVIEFPNSFWPSPIMYFGAIDNRTTFRLIGVVTDTDVAIPSANFSVSFLLRAYTSKGGSSDAVMCTLNLSDFQISGKNWFCINKDITLRSKFPTANIKCGELLVKHNHGAVNYTVEIIISCAILQF